FSGLVDRYRLPQPDLHQGRLAAAAGAHAMTDISDALIEEIVTMATASGLHLDVISAAVPRPDGLDELAAELGVDPVRWALTGGEDHELLAAFSASDVPAGWTVIGTVHAAGVTDLYPKGIVRTGQATVDGAAADDLHGWQSFSEI
ncbi:MAG: thiamine-phosphate kinase, partial [Gordonia sp. (in: high G+C Gram-positive bacteria)]